MEVGWNPRSLEIWLPGSQYSLITPKVALKVRCDLLSEGAYEVGAWMKSSGEA